MPMPPSNPEPAPQLAPQPESDPASSRWEPVKQLMAGAAPVRLGPMHAYHLAHSPRRLLYTLSYYKFAAKLIAPNLPNPAPGRPRRGRVLDIGCGEGLGTWLLAKECGEAHGLDLDPDLIACAQSNWHADPTPGTPSPADPSTPRASFACADFLSLPPAPPSPYHGVVTLDVIEHILPHHAHDFIARLAGHLTDDGVAIIGTPNVTSRPYASAVTNAGHVNMYSGESLGAALSDAFHHVMVFAANDEVVHTGFFPLAHYLLAVACQPRR